MVLLYSRNWKLSQLFLCSPSDLGRISETLVPLEKEELACFVPKTEIFPRFSKRNPMMTLALEAGGCYRKVCREEISTPRVLDYL